MIFIFQKHFSYIYLLQMARGAFFPVTCLDLVKRARCTATLKVVDITTTVELLASLFIGNNAIQDCFLTPPDLVVCGLMITQFVSLLVLQHQPTLEQEHSNHQVFKFTFNQIKTKGYV